MILNNFNLGLHLSLERQEEEIERIKNAPNGTVLYTAGKSDNTDVIQTLIKKSGVQYELAVKDHKVTFVKSSS